MAQNFDEYLNEEFEKARKEFEDAKREAAADILNMSHFDATDTGASCAAHIDKITAAATKVRVLAECKNSYEYFEKKGNISNKNN